MDQICNPDTGRWLNKNSPVIQTLVEKYSQQGGMAYLEEFSQGKRAKKMKSDKKKMETRQREAKEYQKRMEEDMKKHAEERSRRKQEFKIVMDSVRETIPDISFGVAKWRRCPDEHIEGFDIELENGAFVSFSTHNNTLCCEKISSDVEHVETTQHTVLDEAAYSCDEDPLWTLSLIFPCGTKFTLINDHNGYYAHACYLFVNGVEKFKGMLCI